MKLIFLFIFQFIASHYMVIKSCYLLLVEIKYGNTLLFIVPTFLYPNFMFSKCSKGWPHSAFGNISHCRNVSADPGFASLISAQSHTFVEIDHEIITTAIFLPSADSRGVVVRYKRKYVHEVLVYHLPGKKYG